MIKKKKSRGWHLNVRTLSFHSCSFESETHKNPSVCFPGCTSESPASSAGLLAFISGEMKLQSPSQTQLNFSFPGSWGTVLSSNPNYPHCPTIKQRRNQTQPFQCIFRFHWIGNVSIGPKVQHGVLMPSQSAASSFIQETKGGLGD